ncbi:hypothetical protein [Campylobacter sp. CCS1377]|uniref:Lipoprotein n=1 Tax=Campylobacter sp. CCS1377 TaxID=3158229 RepID=A0AAU7E502_9BACT|nr:hypothetical protein [Campylobacter jejuni]
MKKMGFKFVGALALAAFLGGCGEKIEAPTVELFTIFYQNGSGAAKTNIMVQSKDNNTIVEDVIINQGNCGLYKYDYVIGEEYKQLVKDYYEKHKVKYAFDSYEIDDKIHYLQLNLTGANNYLEL